MLVVGGGVYGLTIAYDAAQRGLAVALIDRDDFGSGSSFNHLRTIHGGLRYLQTLDVSRARESIRERRTLARVAPHAVRPLPFVLPLQRSLLRGPTAMRAAFLLDRVIAWDRNRGVAPSRRVPAGRVVSREAAARRFPHAQAEGLAGAAIWHDYVTLEADRLTLAWALAAHAHGALLANHVEAIAPLGDRLRVAGVRAVDTLSGRTIEIGARLVVNAAGASIDRLLDPLGIPTAMPLLKAMNLVTRRSAGDEALGGRAGSGRHLFSVPWRGRALFGTWESPTPCRPGETTVAEADVASFIDEINQAFPGVALTLDDVTLVHRGAVPAIVGADGRTALDGRELIRDHASVGVEGIVSVAGTKYTTARAVAERVTDRVLVKLRRSPTPCRTAETPLPGSQVADPVRALADASGDCRVASDELAHLVASYGSDYDQVLAIADRHPPWRARLADEAPVIGAELVWAVRREMAMTLNDAVIRRTPLGALGHPGDEAARRAANIVGAELGWSEERKARARDELLAFYAIGGQKTSKAVNT